MIQAVLLDAQILIGALDPDANMAEAERAVAKQLVQNLINDPSKKLAITPLLRYEIMCGVKNEATYRRLDDFLKKAAVFEITDKEAYCAIDIYRLARQKSLDLKDPAEPKKYKFDLMHVASADVNSLEFESRDRGVNTLKKLSQEVKSTNAKTPRP